MKKLKVFLIILLVLAIAGAGVYFWQRENIKSLYYSTKYDDDKIDELIVEHNEEVKTYLEEQTDFNVRPSTPAEEKLHQAGVITDAELISILTGKTDLKTLLGTEVTLDEKKNLVGEDGKPVNIEKLIEYKQANQPQAESTDNAQSDNSVSGKENDGGDTAGKTEQKTASADGKKANNKSDTKKAGSQKSDSKKSDKTQNKSTQSVNVPGKTDGKPQSNTSSEAVSNNVSASGSKNENKGSGTPVYNNGTASGNASANTNATDTNSGNSQNGAQGANSTEADKDPSECIAELYALKSSYSAGVEGVINSAINSYSQMKAEEGKVDKSELMGYYNAAVGLEQQCDAAVNQVVDQLTEALEASGGDTAIVDKILDAYANEKSLKKAQYINMIK